MYRDATLRERLARDGKLSFQEGVTGANGSTIPLSIDYQQSLLTTDGSGTDNDFSLPDGVNGQRKLVVLKTKAGAESAVLTPSNLHNGTTLTFDAADEVAELEFVDGAWAVVGGDATLA